MKILSLLLLTATLFASGCGANINIFSGSKPTICPAPPSYSVTNYRPYQGGGGCGDCGSGGYGPGYSDCPRPGYCGPGGQCPAL